MNEELRKLLDSIKSKKKEVKDFCTAGKIEDARKAKDELKDLQAQFDLLYDLEADKLDGMENKAAEGTAKKILDKTKNISTYRKKTLDKCPFFGYNHSCLWTIKIGRAHV